VDGMRNKCITIEQWQSEFKKRKGNAIQDESFQKAWDRITDKLQIYEKVIINGSMCWAVFDDANDQKTQKANVISFNK